MKRSLYSILLVGSVLALLTLFLGLQYKWLSAASDAERERMQKRVETDSGRFVEDFDREMQAAYYNFQTPAAVWKEQAWNEFAARYDFWKERAAYPDLIQAIYFIENKPDASALRYDPSTRAFVPSENDDRLQTIRERIDKDPKTGPVYDDLFATVVPIFEAERSIEHKIVIEPIRRTNIDRPSFVRMPDRYGSVVILLDENTIKQRVLPDLVQKYFPDRDYNVDVVNTTDQPIYSTSTITATDSTARMFNLSPDKLLFFAAREALPKVTEDQREGVVINQRIESHSFSRTAPIAGKTGTFNVELRETPERGRLRTSMLATTGPDREPWTLRVQHSSGSIGAFVIAERNKSFAIGLGVYLLLVGGIVAIVVSALRSRRFAQRQIDFVSSVSHEFRTPLAVIYSAGENLADGVAQENHQVARYGELIKGEGKKLSGMVEQILEFAGASSGKQKYRFSDVPVSDVVEDALAECKPLIESGGFRVEKELQAGLPDVAADRSALSSAIQNLIANSVKYSNGSNWIKVTASNGGGKIKIAVEDRGIGIPSSEQKQIFEPFYRAKQVVDAQISGNGLGLNLVKKIVEAHGGRISVDSVPGTGSTFTIELPQGQKH